MRATASISPVRKGKQRLLGSCAIAAGLAALALGGPAMGQVAGTGQVVPGAGLGGATITNNPVGSPPNTTQVITTGSQTIINWTPTDTAAAGAPIDFLPATNNLNFYGTGQYTVLNRFVAVDPLSGANIPISRQIALNGAVNSYVGSPAAGAGATQGGNIWFYNAGGILIGARAAINVGSLVLTANDIDTTGGLYGSNNEIRFRGAAGSTSSIDISPQSFISAANPGNPGSSYVALVAPRIAQAGLIDVDGSAALVAAEQADITINNGLFDINVTVGAEGGNAITHTGITGGPSHAQGDTDQSRVYLVAIPKNDAVTMLISGQLGYQDAVVAQTDPDGAVVLSAGYNIDNGAITGPAVGAANITIADTVFQSSVNARASGDLVAGPLANLPGGGPVVVGPSPHLGRLIVQGNANFIGDASATFTVGANQIAGATGSMVVQSNGANGAAGSAMLNVTGGGLAVLGSLGVSAAGVVDAATGDSTGGTAAFNVSGGTVVVGGTAVVSAVAVGGFDAAGNGGDGTGGTASLTVQTGGSLTANIVTVQANGRGGGFVASPTLGTQVAAVSGNGQGGTATLTAQTGGSLTANTSINVNATGTGVTGSTQSGNGTGGTATLRILTGGTTVDSPQTNIDASGTGGGTVSLPVLGTFFSANGGDGNGGTAQLEQATDFSSPPTLGALTLTAAGTGGGANGANATGGNATGGNVIISTALSNLTVDTLVLDASATGGSAEDAVGANATSGDANGGTINVTAANGGILGTNAGLTANASAIAGAGNRVGSSDGGAVTVLSTGGATINVATDLLINADAGQFSTAIPTGTGISTGGDVDLTADGGTITVGQFGITARAISNNVTGTAGRALGGTIDIRSANTGLISATDSAGASVFTVDAAAGVSAAGTAATGGRIGMVLDGGTVTFGHNSLFSSTGIAAGGSNPGSGPVLGLGGTILFQLLDNGVSPSTLNFLTLQASADGRAQQAFEGANNLRGAAAGNGGTIGVEVQGGQLNGGSLQISSNGFSGLVAGVDGEGRGGQANYAQTGGAVTLTDLVVSANGFGGVGRISTGGGAGYGGTATIDLNSGTLDATTITAQAVGLAGNGQSGDDSDPVNPVDGGNGGFGQGGTATINLDGDAVVTTTTLNAFAAGIGGDGGGFVSTMGVIGAAGSGGDGQGGTTAINLTAGTLTAGDITSDAGGFGGNGGLLSDLNSLPVLGSVVGGNGGNARGGTATIDVATAVTAGGTVSSIASATGGTGGDHHIGGFGGEARGGTAQLIVTDFNAGNVTAVLDSSAVGGDGGAGFNGAGGSGGFAQGGISRIQADGATARAVVTDANFLTSGTGGNGGNAELYADNSPRFGPNGGNGGDGQGGAVELVANDGTIELGVGRLGVAALTSQGFGGDGGDGADNPGNITLPGPDGMPGTMDDVVVGFVGGQGGIAGGGFGGTVRLGVNGGTLTSNGNAVAISANGTSGTTGTGGVGEGGTLGDGGAFVDQGGTIILEAFSSLANAGSISLGAVDLDASGFLAGRIDIRSSGTIAMTSLTATAQGSSSPTNNDTDLAATGIFLGITDGGLIQTDGAVTLDTTDVNGNPGASVGVYAQGDGQFNVGGALTVNAGDQVDIRHDFRTGTAPTIQTGGQASFTAVNSIRSAPGSLVSAGTSLVMNATGFNSAIDVDSIAADRAILLLAQFGRINVYGTTTAGIDVTANARDEVAIADATAGDDISLIGTTVVAGTLITDGTGLDSELDGSNIFVGTTGAARVDHAEADNDFTADVGSFATGLDTIITGGDIDITSLGAVDLGNSQAGGFIAVTGQSIVFNEIDAGTTVGLTATGVVPGSDAILGNRIDAGDNVTLTGNGIRINDGVFTTDSLFADASGGNARLSATTDGDIVINSSGDIAGTYAAGGNVNLTAVTSITAQATAAGTYVGPNGPSEGYVFFNAGGDANVLAGTSAATMIGVRAGTNANVGGATAGEDLYVLAGNTATVTNSVAGDDMIVTGTCCVIVDNVSTTGAGPDGRSLIFAPATAGGPDVWQLQTGPTDLSNIVLTASAGTIDASNTVAFDNLTATASGVVTTTNTIRSGLVTTIAGSSLDLESVTAGTDMVLTSTAGGISAIGALSAGHDLTIDTATTGQFADLAAGDDIRITAGGDVSAASALATGFGLDNDFNRAGVFIDTPGSIDIAGAVDATGQVRWNAGGTIDSGAITGDFAVIAATGAVNLADITTGGMLIQGSSVDLLNARGNAGQIILRATGGGVTAASVVAQAEVLIEATGAIRITGATQGNNFVQMTGGSIDVADVSSSGFVSLTSTIGAINSTGTISAGSDVAINAATGGTVGALVAGDDVSINAGGDVTVASITAEGSNPQGEEIGSNVAGTVTGTLTVTGNTFAASDVTFNATSIALQSVEAGGALTATSTGGPISLAAGTAGTSITLTSARDVVATGLLQSGGDTTATGRNLDLQAIDAGGDVGLTATVGTIATGGDVSGFNVTFDANGSIVHDNASLLGAANLLTLTAGGNIDVGNATAGDNMRVTAGGSIDANALTAGRILALNADGAVTLTGDAFGAVAVSVLGSQVELNDVALGGGTVALFSTAGDIHGTGSIDANGGVTAIASGTVDLTGDIVAASSADISGAAVNLANVRANGLLTIAATNGAVTATGLLSAGQDLSISTTQGATLNNLVAGDDIGITGTGSVTVTSLRANGTNPQGEEIGSNAVIDITGTLTVTGDSFAADDATFNALSIALQGVETGGSLTATTTGGPLTLTGADAGANVILTSARTVTATGPIQSDLATTIRGTGLDLQSVAAGTDVSLTATTGNIVTRGDVSGVNVTFSAGGDIAHDNGSLLRAGNALSLTAGGAIDIGNADAGGNLLLDAGGAIAANALTSGNNMTVFADGAVDLTGDLDATNQLQIQGASIELNDVAVDAGALALTSTTGGIHGTGAIDVGGPFVVQGQTLVDLTGDIDADGLIDITGGAITVGNVTGGGDVGLIAITGAVNSAGTVQAGNDLEIVTADGGSFNRLVAGDDIRIFGRGDIDIAFMDATGTNPDAGEVGSNSGIDVVGNVVVAHGEAAGNFIVNTASFTTGLNSIIADGNIEVTTTGASNLGNSTAGGNIIVVAQSVDFNALDADGRVNLFASGDAPGAEGIRGSRINAGATIGMVGNSIAMSGAITGDASFGAIATGGNATFATVNTVQHQRIQAGGNISGNFSSRGDIGMFANGDITVSANALGGAVDPDGFVYDGNLFIDAEGDVVLTNSSAGRMLGINALGAAELTNVAAGEDLLVRTGGFGNVPLPVAGANGVALTDVTAGDDIDIRSVGAVTVNGATATGSGPDNMMLDYTANGFTIGQGEGTSAVNGSDIFITSSDGSINAADLSAGDDIVLAGATIALNGATTLGLGQTAGGSNVSTQGGATTLANIDAFDDLGVESSGNVAVTGVAEAGRDIVIAAASADFAALTAPNNSAIDTLDAGRNLTVTTGGAIAGGSIRAGNDLSLSAGGTIMVDRVTSGTGGTMTLSGTDGVQVSALISGGVTSVTSSDGDIGIGTLGSQGPITLVGDTIFVNGVNGDAVFSNILTDEGDAFILGGNNISVTAGSVAGLAMIRSDNNLTVTQLTARQIELGADNNMVLGNVTATTLLAARARNMLTVNGAVVGRDMLIGSGDIAIGATARLGTPGTTQTLEVRNIDEDSTTYIGGAGTRTGYHLDATEMTQIFGNAITILAPDVPNNNGGFVALAPGALAVPIASVGSTTPPTVIIDDFTITAGSPTSNLGANGSLTIATQGKARVIGDAALTGMTDANSFRILADDSIEVILGEGTIRLSGTSTSTPGGMLFLESEDVIVATAQAISDVGAATTTDAIDDRLAENDGILLDDGALYAGGMDVSVVGGFYVQNSGAGTRFAQRRGLTFGPLGLNVNVEGADSRIVINGIHLGPSGQVTGLDAIPLLSINGFVLGSGPLAGSGLAFDSASTMNGCLIVSSTTCAFLEFETSFPVQDVINDDDEEENDGEDADGIGLPIPLITMRDLDPLTGQPLLDDPVTGAGNDDLWTPPSE